MASADLMAIKTAEKLLKVSTLFVIIIIIIIIIDIIIIVWYRSWTQPHPLMHYVIVFLRTLYLCYQGLV